MNSKSNKKMSLDDVIDSAMMLDASIGQVIDKFFSNGNGSICKNSKELDDLLRRFLSNNVYNNKNKTSTFAVKTGMLSDLIEAHNRAYVCDINRDGKVFSSVKIFKNIDVCGNDTPLKVSSDLNSEKSNTKYDYSNGKFEKDIRDDFSKESLESMSHIELLSMIMHYSNKMAKKIGTQIEDNISEIDIKYGKIVFNGLRKNGISPIEISDFCMDYSEYSQMTDKQIEKEFKIDEEKDDDSTKKWKLQAKSQFEEYKEKRKRVREIINSDNLTKEYYGGNKKAYANMINAFSLFNVETDCYELKKKMMNQIMYEIEKEKPENVRHYVVKDDRKSGSNYDYSYNVMIDGYTEPFSVHMASENDEVNIGEDPYEFANSISMIERILEEDGIKRNIKIPITDAFMFIKTSVPFKKSEECQKCLNKLLNENNINWGDALDVYDKEENLQRLYDPIAKMSLSPALAVIRQSSNFMDIIDSKSKDSKKQYTSHGIISEDRERI